MKSLLIFFLLQLMDIATTVLAIRMGGVEQNPLISRFMAVGTIPGLVWSKLVVVAVAGVCVWVGRTQPIRWANVAFALIVAWNLTIIGRLRLLH